MKRGQKKPPTPLTPELRARYQQEFLDNVRAFAIERDERMRREAQRNADQPVLVGGGDAGVLVVPGAMVMVEQ